MSGASVNYGCRCVEEREGRARTGSGGSIGNATLHRRRQELRRNRPFDPRYKQLDRPARRWAVTRSPEPPKIG